LPVNVVLTGFMGTGKTAVGRELSKMLGMDIVDIDDEIERSRKMTINDIFRNFGEACFRDIETEMIRKFSGEDNIIISTGGGAVLREENMEALRANGKVFCLKASPQTILERTSENDDRPLLRVDDPTAKIAELLAARRPFYEKAGTVIETEGRTPLQVAAEIVEILKCKK
jgi:shikimate kinase